MTNGLDIFGLGMVWEALVIMVFLIEVALTFLISGLVFMLFRKVIPKKSRFRNEISIIAATITGYMIWKFIFEVLIISGIITGAAVIVFVVFGIPSSVILAVLMNMLKGGNK